MIKFRFKIQNNYIEKKAYIKVKEIKRGFRRDMNRFKCSVQSVQVKEVYVSIFEINYQLWSLNTMTQK